MTRGDLLDGMVPDGNDSDYDEGSIDWAGDLFSRAYLEQGRGLAHALNRVGRGFSLLIYVPGNCMRAAVSVVKHEIGGREAWQEQFKELKNGETLDEVWKNAAGSLAGQQPSSKSRSIFYNLDFLSDGHGGVYGHPYALSAVFTLIDAARTGVAVGLSDRDEPELPPAIARAFTDRIRIDEIPHHNFHRIVPRSVGERLAGRGELSEGTIWLLASRLRWTDPIHAYRILKEASSHTTSFDHLLQEVLNATRTADYLSPREELEESDSTGYKSDDIERIKRDIILPFQRWQNFRGDRSDYDRALEKLSPGVILHGPPGTGKTRLARWIARKIGLPVRIVSGGELRSSDWGQAERNVRMLFRDARRAAPCVLVLDDADDLLPDRERADGSVASAERAVVNEFLQQMQGVRGRLEGVLVILTTNRFESLDEAARVRMPIHIKVDYPSKEQAAEVIRSVAKQYHYELSPKLLQELVDLFDGPIQDERPRDRERYYSPREIRQAMRLLDSSENAGVHKYEPTAADIDRVRRFYRPERTREITATSRT